MRLAFFGDVVGRSGRVALVDFLRNSRSQNSYDLVIVNGENAAHGFGITQKICEQLFEAGVNAITMGNHTFDQKTDLQIFDSEERLVRPLNYPAGTPGHGSICLDVPFLGKKVLVINLIGRLFMELNDDPFASMSEVVSKYRLGSNVDAIFVDFHGEATAEKIAFARYFDGKISAIVGTHTHVPTADARILNGGTGFLTDCGMCGDYDSCIGMEDDAPIKRFISKVNAYARFSPAQNEATVCGVIIDIGDDGLCVKIEQVIGGCVFKNNLDMAD
ncbi:MAG: TIGR00282 family metallophosphoesterase [Holosporales bacterium]|jgi:metallophosphoesterase (TIGR00282 family)|nr:TIGR00282 family metallophosphoesterase [Holosporales bacterium]